MAAYPSIALNDCLNRAVPTANFAISVCTRCRDICPAEAINLAKNDTPKIKESACTECTACVGICPTDAITHAEVNSVELVRHAHTLVSQGKTNINVACHAAQQDIAADLKVPCHATWSPMLLAVIAAEGVHNLHLAGIDQCASCPIRHGAAIMRQTEKDYATLNHALGIHLNISWEQDTQPSADTIPAAPEPARRAFFRNLLPSITQGAVMAASQINQAAQTTNDNTVSQTNTSPLPLSLQLFLRALPKLQPNFTPVPAMPSLPLGSIQADASCTACGECVEQCPTKALHLKEFGANTILEFRADACIGCKHCIEICPENALEPLPGISLPAILAKRARPLVMVASNKKSPMEKE